MVATFLLFSNILHPGCNKLWSDVCSSIWQSGRKVYINKWDYGN